MANFEDILDLALTELKKGSSMDEVLSKWPQHRQELEALLSPVQTFLSLPRKKAPTPAMQRKYISMPVKHRVWFAWVHISRFASVSMATLLLIAGASTTAYAAMQSLPGQTLFSLKKSAEQMQLHFASSDAERTAMQMNITKKRLAEAQQVFSINSSPQQQLAALNELNSQSDATLQDVKNITKSDNSNPPIAASLKDINSQQQALLNKIQSKDNSQQGNAIKQLKQIVAATNEQATIIALKPDPNSVVISGVVSHIDGKLIAIGETSYLTSTSTIYKDAANNDIKPAELSEGQTITLFGNKNASSTKITAQEILVLDTGAVQSASTTTSTPFIVPTSSATSTKKTDGDQFKKTTSTESSSFSEPTIPDNQAVGTFIPEDPSPQYVP